MVLVATDNLFLMQVDIPDSARSALEALKAKRLQKTKQNAAPIEDTRSPSQSVAKDYDSQPMSAAKEYDSQPMSAAKEYDSQPKEAVRHKEVSSAANGSGLNGAGTSDSAPMTDTLPHSDHQALTLDNAEAHIAPVGDTLPQSDDQAFKQTTLRHT